MAQIYFSDDYRRPLDSEGNVIEPEGKTLTVANQSLKWYEVLYLSYTDNSATPDPVLHVSSYFAPNDGEEANWNNYHFRVKIEISTDDFATVAVTDYATAVNDWFVRGPYGFDYYARANSNKHGRLIFQYAYYVSKSIALPFTGCAYKVRLTPSYYYYSGNWNDLYFAASKQEFGSFAPAYVPITPPAHVYGNDVNDFAASIAAIYISEIAVSAIGGGYILGGLNDAVRTADYPYINTGEATSHIYWYPQNTANYADATYNMTLTMKVIDPGDPEYIIVVGKTVISGSLEFLAESPETMFSATVEIVDPSGLYTDYGYLLRNTEATVVCRAVIAPRYGASVTVAYRPFIGANTGYNQGYGTGYSRYYKGTVPQTIEIEQQIPGSGSSGTTGIKVFGINSAALASQEINAQIIDYAVPSFPDVSIHRCNADGTANDNGDHCKIEWSVSIVPIANQNSKNLTIEHPEGTANIALTSYGQAGILIVEADTESAYDIVFTLTDDLSEVTKTLRLSTAGVIMDWLYGGKGVAFGRVADTENAVEISPTWALIVEKLLFAGVDVGAWMSEIMARVRALEQYVNNEGSTDQFEVSIYNDNELIDRQWVLSGDDAEAPEIIPEREATATVVYSFAGWALTEGATVADPNALLDIVAAREVYAAYTEATRYYSVLFYNKGTLLQTISSIVYRGSATYSEETPTSTDPAEAFVGWSPSGNVIVENEEAQAQFFKDEEITDSWDQILAACKDGSYKSKYALGMYKELDLGTEGKVHMYIHAFQADYVSTGRRRVPITWIAKEALATPHRMNPALVSNTHQQTYDTWELSSDNVGSRVYKSLLSVYANVTAVLEAASTAVGSGTYKIGFKKTESGVSSTESLTLVVTVNGNEVYNGHPTKSYYSPDYVDIPVNAGDEIAAVIRWSDSAWHHNIRAYFNWESVSGGVTDATYTVSTWTATITDSYEDATGSMGGWEKSEMRSYLANTILPLIPENVRNGIKEVRKFTCSEVPDDTASAHYIQVPNQETIDKLCIPSAQELFGNSANEFEGIDFVIDTDHRKKKKAGGSNYINYFMRSTAEYPYSGKTTFARCNSSGVYGTETASTASGVVIEFCT